jgi:hypothetical protein
MLFNQRMPNTTLNAKFAEIEMFQSIRAKVAFANKMAALN